MDENSRCKVDEIIPIELTYAYLGIYFSILIAISVAGFRTSAATFGITNKNASTDTVIDAHLGLSQQLKSQTTIICSKEFFQSWIKDIWTKRRCFLPVLTHLFDQATDIGVIYGFGKLSFDEFKYGSDYCQEINPLYLFIASITVFLFYRIISGISIYYHTRSWIRIVSQLFDLEIFRAIWVNYKLHRVAPSSPQRWIQNLEAMLEAFPQTMIQLYFVIKTKTNQVFVILSLILSLYTMISKVVSEDKLIFEQEWQEIHLKLLSLKYLRKGKCCSSRYMIRLLFRCIDITTRVSVVLLMWIVVGGFSIIAMLILEISFLGVSAVLLHEYVILYVNCMRALFIK